MTIIDVVAALEEGSLPTNHQLIQFIDSIRNSNTLNPNSYSTNQHQPTDNYNSNSNSITSDQLSDSTRTVAQDFNSLLGTIQELIKERNGNEELQTFWWKSKGSYLKVKEEGGIKMKSTNKGKKEEKEKQKLERQKEKSLGKMNGKSVKRTIKDDGQQGELNLRFPKHHDGE